MDMGKSLMLISGDDGRLRLAIHSRHYYLEISDGAYKEWKKIVVQ